MANLGGHQATTINNKQKPNPAIYIINGILENTLFEFLSSKLRRMKNSVGQKRLSMKNCGGL